MQKQLITQAKAAVELEVGERQARRILARMAGRGDRAVVNGLRGRSSNRKLDKDKRRHIVAMLLDDRCCDYGPTLASEMLGDGAFVQRVGATFRDEFPWIDAGR